MHRCSWLLLAACAAPADEAVAPGAPEEVTRPPNFVVILTDDQGFGDLGSYGHPAIRTPHLDALAAEGVRFTQYSAGAPVCTPARAALLTGCYPKRVDLHEKVVFPPDDHGLHPDEQTLAELLRAAGYATGCFGKWHLGHRAGLLPTDQGFDEFVGVPYSNDMAQFHRPAGARYPYRLPWMVQDEVVEWEPDQHELTRRTTDAALAFLDAHADGPFLLYVPYSMPHVPLYASEAFRGRSAAGLYGDVIEELDAAVGELVARVDALGLREDTVILYTSDNGPWLTQGDAGGSAGPLRGGKGTVWEGGHRVPAILRAPGRVPEGVLYTGLAAAMDVLPTVLAWADAPSPALPHDGIDLGPALRGDAEASTRDEYLSYTNTGVLAAIRVGPWKLHLDRGELYHLEDDLGESRDLAAREPERVEALRRRAVDRDGTLQAELRPRGRSEARVFAPHRGSPTDQAR